MNLSITKYILTLSLLLAAGAGIRAQNAPVTTAATVGGAVAGNVDVPIYVTSFNNIGAISLAIDYNYGVMHYTGSTPNPDLQGFATGDLNLNNGYHRITMGWYAAPGVTLPYGSTIITLHFNYISGNSTLIWYDSGPSCEYADGDYNVLNDVPTSDYYINGFVCGLLGNPGTISGMTELCAGLTGVEYSVAPVANATGYVWTVPAGAIIVTGQNTNAITVDFPPNAVSGNIGVSGTNDCGMGPAAELPVTVDVLPIANAGADFSIPYGTNTTLNAAPGGPGSYAYHWSPEELLVNPDDQNPQTVILTSTTVFTLLVTNLATFCQNTDQVVVTITGGPLNVSPVALPGVICQGESSHLYSNAGGGSGDYTYEWTSDPPGSPPWVSNLPNPVVAPETSTHYMLDVYDGFTLVSGNTNLSVLPMPTATISGGDTLCGENEIASLQVDLTGTPPWNFTYSFGSTSVFINGQLTSPAEIIASDGGDYVISALEDFNCTGEGYGTAIVRKYPIPDTPEITVYFSELISSSCCGNQWYRNDTLIPGANNQTYHFSVSGSYTVIVTMNTCSSLPSDPVDIIVGISETDPGKFTFYPNPATNRVSIRTAQQVKDILTISLSSANGIKVKEFEFHNEGNEYMIDVSDLPPGLYFLRLSSEEMSAVGKLIVK